jgi:hypothetical protein
VGQAFPAFANADHLAAHFFRAIDDGFDHGIQARHVAAACQDSDIVFRRHYDLLVANYFVLARTFSMNGRAGDLVFWHKRGGTKRLEKRFCEYDENCLQTGELPLGYASLRCIDVG